MNIAYLVNQYPKTSHSFIRREIVALEALGMSVARFSVRRVGETIVDETDRAEQQRTRVILDAGALAIAMAVMRTLFARPGRFWSALRLAVKVGRNGDRGLLRNLIYLAEACLLREWLAEAKATHVHAHFGTNATTVAMLCRELGGPPYSFTVHGPEEFDRPQRLRLDEKIRRAKFVAAISEFGRSQLYRWCGYGEWSKIHVVRCGVDAMYLDDTSGSAPSPPPDVPRLVCVGRLVEQKGQMLLVQAAARLKAEGRPVEIVFVGDGEMRRDIERLNAELNLNGHVRIAGWMDNRQVREQILAARAMVLPSFAEGLPVVIMEALALRRPVVSTQIAGIPELVESGVNGWLVPAGSVDALTEAMRQVLSAPPQRLAEMGEAGAARVAKQHDVRTEAGKLKALITGA